MTPSTLTTSEPTAQRDDMRAQLARAGLTARQMECLAMHVFDGLSLREIGAKLSIHHTTAQEHVNEAKAKLSRAGLDARRCERDERPKLITMSWEDLDDLDPRRLRAVW